MKNQVIVLLKIAILTKRQTDVNAFASQVWENYTGVNDLIYTTIIRYIGKFDESFADEIMSSFFDKKIISSNYRNFPSDSLISFEKVLCAAIKNHCIEHLNKRHNRTLRNKQFEKTARINSGESGEYFTTKFKMLIKILSFKQQTLILLRLAGIRFDRLATMYQCSSGALRDRYSRIRKKIKENRYQQPFNFRDKQKIEAFLDTIDDKEVLGFIEEIWFSKKDSTEIIDEWEQSGKNSRITILRSLVYVQRYIRKAA